MRISSPSHSTSRLRRAAVAVAVLVGLAACSSSASDTVEEVTPPTLALGTLPSTLPPTAPPTAAATTTLLPTTAATTAPPDTVAAVATEGGVPSVDAAAYAVFDVSSREMMAEREIDAQRAVGSLIKLLTVYVAMQAGDPSHIVTVPEMQLDPMESVIGLYAGEQLQREVLIRAMMIVSANDAARALANDIGGSEAQFVAMMNDAASRLRLSGTVAANPVGLDAAGQHSTARDLVMLANVLMADQTFRTTVARTSANLHGQTFPATNDLLTKYVGADGIKTGHTTDAGWCIVASATRDGRTVIAAVLGAPTEAARDAAATALLDWAFAS